MTFISLLLVKALIFKWKVKFSSLDLDMSSFLVHSSLGFRFLGVNPLPELREKNEYPLYGLSSVSPTRGGCVILSGRPPGLLLGYTYFSSTFKVFSSNANFPLAQTRQFPFFVVDVGCQVIPTTCSVPRKVLLIFIKLLCCHPSS